MPRNKAELEEEVGNVFNDCQRTFASHPRGLATLRKLQQSDGERFLKVGCLYSGFFQY